MTDHDVIVIGAGIIGATITRALRNAGRYVTLIDDRRPNSGTYASGGHVNPDWVKMSSDDKTAALTLLDETWGLIKEEYLLEKEGGSSRVTMYRVDTDKVLEETILPGTVTSIGQQDTYYPIIWYTCGFPSMPHRCKDLIVCAGIWCDQLIPDLELIPKQGISFRFNGTLDTPFIKPWAPYKQIIAHQQSEGQIWAGDGTAILPVNWTTQRSIKCRDRCHEAVKRHDPFSYVASNRIGIRPYTKAKLGKDPCLYKQIGPHAWVVTGGGKSSTIAAGWATRRLLDELV
jgi:glycine/D-amino acid oxidase-like deaminating enzyme